MELSLDIKNDLVVESKGSELAPFRPEEVAYVIDDELFEGFQVNKTFGWWREKRKVRSLIDGFKKGYNISQSCIKARISPTQYRYFLEYHPSFYIIKNVCEENFKMKIRNGIDYHLEKATPSVIMWAAEKKLKEEYGKDASEGSTLNNYGTINNNQIPVIDLDPLSIEMLEANRGNNGS